MAGVKVESIQSPWLTTRGVAKYLGVSTDWVDDRRKEGLLPFHKVGHTIFMKVKDIDKLIERNKVI